jgi:hypothetical protein
MSWRVFVQGVFPFSCKTFFQKCPKFILPKYNVLENIIYNNSVSGVHKFPIFVDIMIFYKFWKNEFLWNKSRVLLVSPILPMLHTNTYVYLQYASSSTRFRVIGIFSISWNFVKVGVLAFLWNLDFSKMYQTHYSLI